MSSLKPHAGKTSKAVRNYLGTVKARISSLKTRKSNVRKGTVLNTLLRKKGITHPMKTYKARNTRKTILNYLLGRNARAPRPMTRKAKFIGTYTH